MLQKIDQIQRDAVTDALRRTMPLRARWALHHTMPKMAEASVNNACVPLHACLQILANIAVQNRKLIVGM
jgi:hypothetical protein